MVVPRGPCMGKRARRGKRTLAAELERETKRTDRRLTALVGNEGTLPRSDPVVAETHAGDLNGEEPSRSPPTRRDGDESATGGGNGGGTGLDPPSGGDPGSVAAGASSSSGGQGQSPGGGSGGGDTGTDAGTRR